MKSETWGDEACYVRMEETALDDGRASFKIVVVRPPDEPLTPRMKIALGVAVGVACGNENIHEMREAVESQVREVEEFFHQARENLGGRGPK